MAPTSILRNGLTSPARSVLQTRPRPALKRPAALPASPLSASFSSPAGLPSAGAGLKSPHVHFPPSAVLAATFATHSPRSYDRTAIPVSPNPLALPAWGDRIYSPSRDGFRLGAAPSPRPFRSLSYQASPIVSDFEDPRSPKLQPAAKTNVVRFSPFPVTPLIRGAAPRKPTTDLRASLETYPRSPYPSAPISQEESSSPIASPGAEPKFGSDWPEDKKAALSRSQSIAQSQSARNKKGLSLSGSRKPGGSFPSLSSPLTQSCFSPGADPSASPALKRSHKPTPLNLGGTPESEKLSKAFWGSMSLHEPALDSAASEEAMVTALEYPESAVSYEATHEAQLQSSTAPPMLYAGADLIPSTLPETPLWSPGRPQPGRAVQRIRESLCLLSPAPKVQRAVARKEITAPSPNDPFAAFPSFAAALEGGMGIKFPEAVVAR